MRSVILGTGLLFAMINTSVGQDEVQPPTTIPQWVVLTATQDEQVSMDFPNNDISRMEAYAITIPFHEAGADGKLEPKSRTETRLRERKIPAQQEQRFKTIRWRAKDLEFLDPMGKKLDFRSDVVPRLTKPTRAMAVTDSKIDPFFASLLKADTLIVVIPKKVGR